MTYIKSYDNVFNPEHLYNTYINLGNYWTKFFEFFRGQIFVRVWSLWLCTMPVVWSVIYLFQWTNDKEIKITAFSTKYLASSSWRRLPWNPFISTALRFSWSTFGTSVSLMLDFSSELGIESWKQVEARLHQNNIISFH